MTAERQNGIAYAFLAPALVVMMLCGVVPMGFVAYYSLHDTFAGNSFVWVGTAWYQSVLSSREFWWALARSFGFSALVLLVEIPLGILEQLLHLVEAVEFLGPFPQLVDNIIEWLYRLIHGGLSRFVNNAPAPAPVHPNQDRGF